MNNIEKLVASCIMPAQDLENALQQLKRCRFIDTAEGAQLDTLGRLVGQARDGLDDATYRRYVRARIVANFSKGRIEDLIKVVDLVVYDEAAYIKLTQEGTATERLQVHEIAVSNDLAEVVFEFINDSKSAGVRIVLHWSEYLPNQTFTLDTGPGLDVSYLANTLR